MLVSADVKAQSFLGRGGLTPRIRQVWPKSPDTEPSQKSPDMAQSGANYHTAHFTQAARLGLKTRTIYLW